jgi:predicted nucleic acid-binding protein
MNVKVVDASALGALVFGEPEAEKIAHQLTGYLLMGPHLLWYELASIGLKKIRTHPEQSGPIRKAFQLASSLPIETVEVEHSEVIELAREADLTTYDASYLWLARKMKGTLFTLDRKLIKSAELYDVSA